MSLEQTILDTAAQRLREFESYHRDGTNDEKIHSYLSLTALTELARFQDSGLSQEACDAMIEMEHKATRALNDSKANHAG